MQTQMRNRWTYGIMGALALVLIIFNLNCGKKERSNVKAEETTPKPLQNSKKVQDAIQPSAVSQRLSQALSDGKYVYLFFYESGNINCGTMEKYLDTFSQKTTKNVEIIKVDRKDPKNKDIVTKLRVQTAPIPLTLLYDPKSAVVAAFTKVVTEKELTQAFPSPKKSEALRYVYQGKGVILSFSNKKMPSRGEVQARCSQAKSKLAGKAEYISVDLSDSKEARFIEELKINPNTPEPVTFVINFQGQMTGKYEGEVQVTDLVAAATRVVKSGCCPPSSGKTCDSTKAKKE